ncbi:50S ribosomal protein L35 [Thalassorhabdus alkalitolerans]|uniref:Large ribosomal subunit protein bL35 n=1 Tax=Thalassorhabdus alkalitolerans TaxID=2282697 RepID=A0ABW0YK20_9BACI|nr:MULTISPECIES: 50S ribosomal protein L35 [Bacillaceae]
MPKMKTHSGAAKRFRKTGNGKLKRSHAFTSHMFRNKSEKQKRNLSKTGYVDESDQKRIKDLMPYK